MNKKMSFSGLCLVSFLFFFFSCSDPVVEEEDPIPASVVGMTFSGYSFKSTFSGAEMYKGFQFFSPDSCYDLLLEKDSRISSKKKRYYSLDYPEVKIYDSNAAVGYWIGTFSGDYLFIQSLKLKKW